MRVSTILVTPEEATRETTLLHHHPGLLSRVSTNITIEIMTFHEVFGKVFVFDNNLHGK